jgi:hypothetical protein
MFEAVPDAEHLSAGCQASYRRSRDDTIDSRRRAAADENSDGSILRLPHIHVHDGRVIVEISCKCPGMADTSQRTLFIDRARTVLALSGMRCIAGIMGCFESLQKFSGMKVLFFIVF